MAFNPFTSFRKHQKFWMALILLTSMVTFVLCTGVGGDLSDWLIRIFAPRGSQSVAEMNSGNIYRKDLEDLRIRRNVADLFMRDATKLAIKRLNDTRTKDANKILESKRKEMLPLLAGLEKDLTDRLSKPRYFQGGVKYNDLLDFMVWLHQADRLGITLDAETMRDLVYQAVHGRYSGFDESASRQVQYEVRGNVGYGVTDEMIFKALHDEFRVQVAQLALLGARPDSVLRPGMSIRAVSIDPQIRRPVSPEQIWEDYRKNRSEFDVALVPINVDDFLKEVPTPTEAQLQDYYERNRDNEFNPTTDVPSFRFPPRMKVQWVSADPESPLYRHLARTATTLEITPVLAWTPMLPAPLAAVRYAAQSAAWDASLERNYDNLKRDNFVRYVAPPLTEAGFLLPMITHLDKTVPSTWASLVGVAARPGLAFAAPLTFQADIYFRHQPELAAILPGEAKKRWPLAGSLVLSGAASEWFPVGLLLGLSDLPQFLPLDMVRNELRDKIELMMGSQWARTNMMDVKNKLELPGTPGNKKAMERRLAELTKRYGLEMKTTEQFHNRYDIDKAASLQPLLKAFEKARTTVNLIEGRAGTEGMLKEDDYWRLFFDSSIGHSIENAGLYVARPWPPYAKQKSNPMVVLNPTAGEGQTIPLFEKAERPFLFWQTEFEPARLPVSLDEVRAKVMYAWKHKEARTKALAKAKAIALSLQGAGKNVQSAAHEEASKQGHDAIILRGIAPQVPMERGATNFRAPQAYGPYELPKGLFTYPRGDLVKELLTLNQLSKDSKDGIKIDNRELDDLNEELLKRKVEGKQVQVLTNRPRSNFYVAAVTNAPDPSWFLFTNVYKTAAQDFAGDEFVNHYQEEAGKEYRTQLMQQLRKAVDLKPNSEAQKSFDTGG